jgi:hypothetical protein
MRKLLSLNGLYAQYTEGALERKKFEGLIFQAILDEPRRFSLSRWERDDCEDFVSWVYPRLSRAIDAYRDRGASFEAYVGAMIRLSSKEYRSRMMDKRITEYTAWTLRSPDMYACQSSPEYTGPEAVYDAAVETEDMREDRRVSGTPVLPGAKPGRKKSPRQLLILIMKCYYYVSDDFLERAAPLAGIEKEYLKQLIDKLRQLRFKRDEELRGLRERIHCQYYRCIIYEKRLAAMTEHSTMFLKMESRLEKARRRLAAMRKRLAGIRPDATNRQIAEIIGLSKGTVDATLFTLKKRWKNDPNKLILN